VSITLSNDTNNYSDLWIKFLNGNNDAFSEIYKLSYRALYSYGLSFKISEEQVRDIIQDVFLKLYSKPDYIRDKETIRPFLFASIRNGCLNILKSQPKYSDFKDVDEFNLHYSINDTGIENKEGLNQINNYVKHILEKLTKRQKEIIYLRFLHQMDYEEISEIMNLSEQAARNLTHRAITKLRKENKESYLLLFILLFL